MIECFRLISKLKNIKKEKYILSDEEIDIMKKYYKSYDLNIGFNLYKKVVIDLSINSLSSIHKSCEYLTKEIVKNGKSNR